MIQKQVGIAFDNIIRIRGFFSRNNNNLIFLSKLWKRLLHVIS